MHEAGRNAGEDDRANRIATVPSAAPLIRMLIWSKAEASNAGYRRGVDS